MNLTFILIAGVLTMTSMAIGLISVQAPRLNSGDSSGPTDEPEEKEEEKKLNLTLFITDQGYNLAASGATLDGSSEGRPGEALFPKKGETYDYDALQRKLIEIKKVFKREQSVIIVADPDVLYDDIVQTMDAARATKDNKELFPAVAFSPGIVG